MRTLALLALVLSSFGCRGVTGPFRRDRDPDKVTDPMIAIEEQKRRGRATFSSPTEDLTLPRSFDERYGPTGR
jgi:hypothetical protein